MPDIIYRCLRPLILSVTRLLTILVIRMEYATALTKSAIVTFSSFAFTIYSKSKGIGVLVKVRLKSESLVAVFRMDSYIMGVKTIEDPRPVMLSQFIN